MSMLFFVADVTQFVISPFWLTTLPDLFFVFVLLYVARGGERESDRFGLPRERFEEEDGNVVHDVRGTRLNGSFAASPRNGD